MKMNDQQLLQKLGALADEREPGRDLWPEIQQRISTPGSGVLHQRSWFNAVAALLIIGLSLTLGMQLGSDQGELGHSDDQALVPEWAPMSQGQLYANLLELEYAGALRDVAGQFRAGPMGDDGPGDIVLSESLRILQQATQDLRDALQQNPDSMYLADLLASTHRKRMNLLRNLALAGVVTSEENLRAAI